MPDLLLAPAPPSVPVSEPVVCAPRATAQREVTGDEAIAFLQGQLSSDVAALSVGQGQLWSYNSPKGRTLANGVLWRADAAAGPPRVLVLLAADLAEAIARRLAMYVLRAKATVRDVRDQYTLLGLAGAGSADAARTALGVSVATLTAVPFRTDATAVALPDGRVVIASPASGAPLVHAALARHAATADASMWRWFAIAAGVPKVTAATSDLFVPQALNWDLLGGVSFQKGCYPGQEIVARMRYLGRLKERLYAFRTQAEDVAAATRLHSAAFGDQACGTVVNAAPDPAGGSALLAVVQREAADAGDVRLGAVDGPPLLPQRLPYDVPAADEPRVPRKL
jgi:folate-binding protein YgfZ